jgi:hypothetical protein
MKTTEIARQRELCHQLIEVLDSEDRQVAAGDMVAYKALVRHEARLMDELKVGWRDDA